MTAQAETPRRQGCRQPEFPIALFAPWRLAVPFSMQKNLGPAKRIGHIAIGPVPLAADLVVTAIADRSALLRFPKRLLASRRTG